MKKTLWLFVCVVLCMSLCLAGCSRNTGDSMEAVTPQTAAGKTSDEGKDKSKKETAGQADTEEQEVLPEFNTDTEFDTDLLKNWNDEALKETYGVEGIRDFKPSDPQPMTYIVSAPEVIDPVTDEPSEGGYNKASARHLPIDTDRLIYISGRVWGGGLSLTDDPDQAAYALILDFDYKDSIGTFHFSDHSQVAQYNSATQATLLDLVTGESISTEKLKEYATEIGESVSKEMLNAAKGKQLYSACASIWDDNFPCYWEFTAGGQRRADAFDAMEQGLTVITLLPYPFDVLTRRELAEYLMEKGTQNVTLQDDGCVTIIISEEERETRLADIQKDADDLAAELEKEMGIKRTTGSDEIEYPLFYVQDAADVNAFAPYAARFQFYGKVYSALNDGWGHRIVVTLNRRDDGKTIYEIDSALAG